MHTYSLTGSWFWFLSFVIVGTNIIIAFVLLSGVHRALLGLGRTRADRRRIVSIIGIVLFGWLGLALFLGWQGSFRSAVNQPVPPIALAMSIPSSLGRSLSEHQSRSVRLSKRSRKASLSPSNSTAYLALRFWPFTLLGSCPESLLYRLAGVMSRLA